MKKLISLIVVFFLSVFGVAATAEPSLCLLYTSDAADE